MNKLYGEFLGTFALVFVGIGSILNNAGLVGVALAHGLTIAVAVSAFAGFSNAHFNPAVSIAFFATKRLSLRDLGTHIAAQLLGATVGAFAINAIYPGAVVGTPSVASGISSTGAVIAEAIATALLVATIFGVAVDKRGTFASVAGLPIGLIITAGILAIGPATGAALNPARWFGPALIAADWSSAWIYIVGPIAGALLAAISYEKIAKPA